MGKLLEQRHIDTLFAQQGEAVGVVSANMVEAYNFGLAGQISNEQMRAISLVNEQFARSLTHTLGAWLRSELRVAIAANEQLPYTDVVSSFAEPCYVCLLRLEPLGGMGLLEINVGLALMMVDLLLGGRGVGETVREMTEIEETILTSVLVIVVRELNVAWESAGLKFEMERRESHNELARMLPTEERTLCVSFDIEMAGQHGMFNLCLPAVVLNAMHRRLMAMRDKPNRRLQASSARVAELLNEAEFPVTLRLPSVRLLGSQIRSMEPGMLLEFSLSRYSLAELRVGGVPLGTAVPIRRGEHRAAQVGTMSNVLASVHPAEKSGDAECSVATEGYG